MEEREGWKEGGWERGIEKSNREEGGRGEATCTEETMVLRAKIVAQSLTVDWLSNAPCVSSKRIAT